jgi:TonB family protein
VSERSECVSADSSEKLSDNPDRRSHLRQPVSFGYVELGKHNGGILINVSEGGLAVQAARGVAATQLPQLRFQLVQCGTWIETSGRIVWTSASKKMLGISFLDLRDDSRSQVKEWIFSDIHPGEEVRATNPESHARKEVFDSGFAASTIELSATENDKIIRRVGNQGQGIVRADAALHVPGDAGEKVQSPVSGNVHSFSDPSKSTARSAKTVWPVNAYRLLATATLAILLVIALFEVARRTSGSSSPATFGEAHMGLKLERSGSDLRLSWNPDSPAIASANKAQLLITDGASHKFLELDSSDLRSGSILYAPATGDVILRLEVDKDDSSATTTESIRISGAQQIPPASPVAGRVSGIVRTDSVLVDPTTGVQSKDTKSASASAVVGQTNLASLLLPHGKGPVSPMRPVFKSRQPGVADSTFVPPPEAEQVAPVGLPGISPSSGLGDQSMTANAQFEAAQLMAKREPTYPQAARDDHFTGLVEVRFRIHADGTVHDVKVVKGNPLLGFAAAEAVQTWRYRPARLGGSPVETDGSAVLNFK